MTVGRQQAGEYICVAVYENEIESKGRIKYRRRRQDGWKLTKNNMMHM